MTSHNSFLKSTIIGGIFMLIVFLVLGMIGNAFLGFDVATLPGTRAMNDPVAILVFVYPFVLAAGAFVLYNKVKSHLKGSVMEKAMGFGKILTVAFVIPMFFLLVSSMNYPAGFYVTNILQGVIGYTGLGYIFAHTDK